ncbi:MAG: dephospho-CoA kinase [Verrucomicrobiota bacterium]
MKTFGLTGGIGMGKSTAAQLLRSRGLAVIDTDDLARQVVQPGQPALVEICQTFGSELQDASGELRRDALAKIVFADPVAREKLEAITHPRITRLWREQLQAWRAEGRSVAVVVIPLLFETKVEAEFDAIICLACAAATQQQRLAARGWSGDQIQQRLAAQLPVVEKMSRAHFVVWSEGAVEMLSAQLTRIIPVG